ncbi:MAG: fumarylacetoacetate hydrolase family protein [Candidatus Sphingomonas colombiensis]|nr:fumarylacetoacetate hydrolase family protein [Sphingomonas sp.]WEK43987.1 MAG: fumarylacetoacetate hydrolase family protein [Sphingomonas sp.]
MIAGTVYGVVLNDAAERGLLADAFTQAPYRAPPIAPVLYIKPRNCITRDDSIIAPDGLAEVSAAATIGLVMGRDTTRVTPDRALDHVAAAALVLDLSEPVTSYYRPTVRQRCRDGFLPVGAITSFHAAQLAGDIVTRIDGADAHRWSPSRAVRDAARLIADVSAFMTLAAGDMLLIGLPHDAPRARAGQRIEASMAGLSPVRVTWGGQG